MEVIHPCQLVNSQSSLFQIKRIALMSNYISICIYSHEFAIKRMKNLEHVAKLSIRYTHDYSGGDGRVFHLAWIKEIVTHLSATC